MGKSIASKFRRAFDPKKNGVAKSIAKTNEAFKTAIIIPFQEQVVKPFELQVIKPSENVFQNLPNEFKTAVIQPTEKLIQDVDTGFKQEVIKPTEQVIKVIDEKFKEVIVNPIKDIIATIDLGFLGIDNSKKEDTFEKTIQVEDEVEVSNGIDDKTIIYISGGLIVLLFLMS